MQCSVSNCKSNNKKINKWRFFRFPKCAEVCKKWIEFCGRNDAVNPKTACLCNKHFTPDDFERNLQYEMGFASKNPTKLRPGAIPTMYPVLLKCSKTFLEEDAWKELVNAHLKESVEPAEEFSAADDHSSDNICALEQVEKVKLLKIKVEKLKRENIILKKGEKKYAAEINKLKDSLRKAEVERDNVERELKCIFTEG